MKKLTVGIMGTAKNTGKTTSTIALLNYFCDRAVSVGLTSIGFDGERLDNVTGLPKPRLFVRRNVLAATAETCLAAGSAGIRVIERLGVGTPLGEVICGRVEREGLLVLAGPNQSKYLRPVIDFLHRQGAALVMVDGALNRIVPVVETDGLILATGASYKQNIAEIARDAGHISAICNRPGQIPLPAGIAAAGRTVLWDRPGHVLADTVGSLFQAEDLRPLMNRARSAGGFFCPGVVSPGCLKEMLQMPFPRKSTFIFADPVKLIVGGDPAAAAHFITAVNGRGGTVGYLRPLPLLAVTVNPFYPRYRYETRDYQPAYVDGEELLHRVSSLVDVPVCDVVAQGGEKLSRLVEAMMQKD
ncbi:hypothetical protein [Desulfotomaculum copahuensis]|uniref:Uncharacterized protein n=1 Tax=Desulfotomaculum copahuensis TaxID=1838280 RepID=A0A1B7LGK6_9FIRM|nr:hypothetical protein [Desulfotomaculum copahuensis]OAT85235.1 hypothetical protein A6M21_06745 [Desulfotomaculum copahuensis]